MNPLFAFLPNRFTRGAVRLLGAASLAALAGLPLAVHAQGAWPNRVVKIVVPFSAGSGTDVTARLVAEHLSSRLGQPFVVENKQGADGLIGAEQVAKSTPDGYTLGVIPSSAIVMNPALYKMPFDPMKDLVPVANLAGVGLVLGVQPEMPVRNVAELVAYLKERPGQLNFAAGSTFTRLAGEMFKHATGTDVVAIPYKGTAPQVTAMLGKEVQIVFDPFLGLPHMKAGKIRPLAVTSASRSSVLPELPTLRESGLRDVVVETWIAVFAPAGTPAAVVDKLRSEVAQIMALPDVRARLAGLSYDVITETPEQFSQRIRDDTARWAKTVKDANFKLNP
ncbi:Bug family tripartite tricarboxylate transporter substrate binding protein [Hydrogenophaga sp. BPS33]|uniref:Bug family tripartite tricarboxylate transporter substrate binding protein n=1 Tax=Hydrogenophaga sp. BPS33 TaxID=2651974 RepID=UPI0013200205|nr:tripartite tricarboxylate transporter substrate binding protein [Hydrogenophaga sp. BPS33]QHE83698.1 tripartite tricarboxylate transporter substrate binding protein [Hydrogenophaga sp. BPS33]